MARSVPEAIEHSKEVPIALDDFSIGYIAAVFDEAVVNYGSAIFEDRVRDDMFKWRSWNDTWDYRLVAEGEPEVVDGFLLDRWTLSRTPAGEENPNLAYYFDPVAAKLGVFEQDGVREPSFKEVADFFMAAWDLNDEINKRKQDYMYRFAGDLLISTEIPNDPETA